MIRDQIAQLIEERDGGNKTRFARNIGIPNGNSALVHDWLSGKSTPKAMYQTRICETYNVTPQWLNDGEGVPNSSEVSKRINWLIARRTKYNKTEFARRIGIPSSDQILINKWILGLEIPNEEYQDRICMEYSITRAWLYGLEEYGCYTVPYDDEDISGAYEGLEKLKGQINRLEADFMIRIDKLEKEIEKQAVTQQQTINNLLEVVKNLSGGNKSS